MAEEGHGQVNRFARYYQFGVSFLRRTNFNTSGYPKVKELTINPNDTADLPCDYVRYTRIALCIDGQLICLGLDESMCLNRNYNACGVPVSHYDNNNNSLSALTGAAFTGNALIADNFVNGEFVGRMFGIGADNNSLGYYRIDPQHRQIQFSALCMQNINTETNN